jgi:hypothetical protein
VPWRDPRRGTAAFPILAQQEGSITRSTDRALNAAERARAVSTRIARRQEAVRAELPEGATTDTVGYWPATAEQRAELALLADALGTRHHEPITRCQADDLAARWRKRLACGGA